MFPIVDGIEAEFEGRVAVVRLNAAGAEITDLLTSYGLRGHPSFAILNDQNEVTERFTGPQTADILRQALTAVADN